MKWKHLANNSGPEFGGLPPDLTVSLLNGFGFTRTLFRANFEFKGKHSHRFISICQKKQPLFLQGSVVRYVGKIGKFYCSLWLIYPTHCISILSKLVKYCRSWSYDLKNFGVFLWLTCSVVISFRCSICSQVCTSSRCRVNGSKSILGSWPWPVRDMRRHQSRDHSICHTPFPIGGLFEWSLYIYRFLRYSAPKAKRQALTDMLITESCMRDITWLVKSPPPLYWLYV